MSKLHFGIFLILILFLCSISEASRIKDLASIKGVRDNQVWGYGLVVGLPGTGDKGLDFTQSSLNMVLKGLGADFPKDQMATQNAAAVVVSATLPPFAGVGTKIDIIVSSVGSASSLLEGNLMMTPLRGADGKVYAVAQGKINQGGTAAQGSKATARLLEGATLERAIDFDFSQLKKLEYQLREPDFTTAARIARTINSELGSTYAKAINPAAVEVIFPPEYEGKKVQLVARIESIDVEADSKAKVVMNRATGTVIMGSHVQISPVAIAHGNLRIQIEPTSKERKEQIAGRSPKAPRSLSSTNSDGEKDPAVAPTETEPLEASVMLMNGGTNVADLVAGLNEMGASPQDLIQIVQSLKDAGALRAEVVLQ